MKIIFDIKAATVLRHYKKLLSRNPHDKTFKEKSRSCWKSQQVLFIFLFTLHKIPTHPHPKKIYLPKVRIYKARFLSEAVNYNVESLDIKIRFCSIFAERFTSNVWVRFPLRTKAISAADFYLISEMLRQTGLHRFIPQLDFYFYPCAVRIWDNNCKI